MARQKSEQGTRLAECSSELNICRSEEAAYQIASRKSKEEPEGEKSSKLKKNDAITLIKYCGGTIYDENIDTNDTNDTNDNCNRSHIRLSNQLKKPTKIDKQMQGTQMSFNSCSINSGNNELVYTNKLLSINFLIDAICNQQVPYNFSPYELRS
jgi:hypothetical protein